MKTTTNRSLGLAFYEAIMACSYISDPVIRDTVMLELAETNALMRSRPRQEPVDRVEQLRQSVMAEVAETSPTVERRV